MTDSDYWARLNGRRIARRSVLRGGAVGLVGLGGAALIGCSGGGGGDGGGGSAATAVGGTPTPVASCVQAPQVLPLRRRVFRFLEPSTMKQSMPVPRRTHSGRMVVLPPT